MVILLNGCINAGKTTIGKEIASMGVGFAHIEVDHLRHFISWMPLEESIELSLKNAADIAINFHEKGIDSVITYPLSNSDYKFIFSLLKNNNIPSHAVTLFPGLERLKSNRGERQLTAWELSRIDELHRQGLSTPNFGCVINNAEKSVRDTALEVLRHAGLSFHQHHQKPIKCHPQDS